MEILLETKNLSIEYKSIKEGETSKILALDNVSLKIQRGEIYALAGESGCGKSTLAKALTKLVTPISGDIIFEGKSILNQSKTERKLYPKNVQMVFQNPYSSLNPKMKIKEILKEPLDINTSLNRNEKDSRILEVLSDVGLQDSCLNLYPHEFSGGQRQRIAIARALILNPKLLIADEPVSALDASIQAQIINLLKELQKKRNLTILFISHDMNVIKYLANRVGIMYYGKLIEENITPLIFQQPREDYTKNLLRAVPILKV
jgi:peptide/nickel transport system ATP-binding protein/oligopeptide transport system ATP-binding protein